MRTTKTYKSSNSSNQLYDNTPNIFRKEKQPFFGGTKAPFFRQPIQAKQLSNSIKFVDSDGKQNIPKHIAYVENDVEGNMKKFNNFMTTLNIAQAAAAFHPVIGIYVRRSASVLISVNKRLVARAQGKMNSIDRQLDLLERRRNEIFHSVPDPSLKGLDVDKIPMKDYDLGTIKVQREMLEDLKEMHKEDKQAAQDMISGLEGFTKKGVGKSVAVEFMSRLKKGSSDMKDYIKDPDKLEGDIRSFVREKGWGENTK